MPPPLPGQERRKASGEGGCWVSAVDGDDTKQSENGSQVDAAGISGRWVPKRASAEDSVGAGVSVEDDEARRGRKPSVSSIVPTKPRGSRLSALAGTSA